METDQQLEEQGDALFSGYGVSGDLGVLDAAIAVYEEVLRLRPIGHSRRLIALSNLGTALGRRCQNHSGDSVVTDRCVSLHREALRICSMEEPSRSDVLDDLCNSLLISFQQQANLDILAEVAILRREALSLCPPGHPSRDRMLNNLAGALQTSFELQGDLDALNEAVTLHREALVLRPAGHPRRDYTLSNLASALQTSYEQQGEPEILAEAVALYRESLASCPPGHPRRDHMLNNLANVLQTNFDHHGDLETLNEAIVLFREALVLCPPGHPLRDYVLSNLGNALFTSFEQEGSWETLAESITIYREALSLCPIGHPRRDGALNNLANSLLTSFEQRGGLDALGECVVLYREALLLCPTGHPRHYSMLSNLANALMASFQQQGSGEILAEVIVLRRQILLLCPPGHPRRNSMLSNLANALQTSFEQRGDDTILAEAITLHRDALHTSPPGHPLHTHMLSSLGNALKVDFDRHGSAEVLEEAIQLHRDALTLRTRSSHPLRDSTLINLADSLLASFQHHGFPDALTDALTFYREAVLLRPTGHPLRYAALGSLAIALQLSFETASDGDAGVLSEAFVLCSDALELCPRGRPDRSWLSFLAAQCLLHPNTPIFDLTTAAALISEGLGADSATARTRLNEAARTLLRVENSYPAAIRNADGSTTETQGILVLSLYSQAIRLLPRLANFGLEQKARLQAITGLDDVSRHAAARALLLDRVSDAVEMLEEGRGVFWAQALHLRASGLDGIPQEDRKALQLVFEALESGSPALNDPEQSTMQREQMMEDRRKLNVQAEELIAKVRTYPGLQRFLMPATFDTLMRCLPDGYVVMLNTSELGSHALLLHRPTGLATSLKLKPPRGGFNSDTITVALPRGMDSVELKAETTQPRAGTRAIGVKTQRSLEPFDALLESLWKRIVQPIVGKLDLQKAHGRSRPRVWWCVTGHLGFLPIHAAGRYSGKDQACASDYLVSSYVPTLSALAKARSQWTPIPRAQLSGLLICETSFGPDRLYNVLDEVRAVQNCFDAAGARILNTPSAHTSLSRVQELLGGMPANVVHLACHGVQAMEPLESSFVLEDGRLSIEDIMKLDLPRATLAYLSACQTAKGSRLQPDQTVHLAASMLFCGFRSVVGTMWRMHDEDGPQVAHRVYKGLFQQEQLDLDDIPYALDDAICNLRRSGVKPWRWSLFVHMGG